MRNITITYSKKVEVSFKRNKRFKKPTWDTINLYDAEWEVDKIADFYIEQYPDTKAMYFIELVTDDHGDYGDQFYLRIRFDTEADEAEFILRESL